MFRGRECWMLPERADFQAGNGVAQRALAHAVAADDRKHAVVERHGYALNGVALAVIDLQVLDLQRGAPPLRSAMAASEINFLHLLIVLDFLGRAFFEHAGRYAASRRTR